MEVSTPTTDTSLTGTLEAKVQVGELSDVKVQFFVWRFVALACWIASALSIQNPGAPLLNGTESPDCVALTILYSKTSKVLTLAICVKAAFVVQPLTPLARPPKMKSFAFVVVTEQLAGLVLPVL